MFERIKQAFSSFFAAADLSAVGEVVTGADYGPGITANSSGGYYSAGGDGSGWPYGLTTGASPVLDHTALRQNARVAYHDSMPARSMVERYADIVAGTGLRFESMPRHQLLGITPEEAEEIGTKITEAFDAYMASKTFSLIEDQTGYQSQRLVSLMQQRDGEYFARLSYSARADLLNPLQVQFLDPSQIQGDTYTGTDGLPYCDSGIQYDSVGREIGYKIATYDYKTNQQKVVNVPRVGARSKRLLMLHGWQKEYPGQRRGYSRLAHALQAFDSFASFEHAHIRKAINDAAFTFYVKPPEDRPATNFLEDMTAGPVGPYDAPNEPGTNDDNTWSLNYSEINTVNMRPDSAAVFNLKGGEDLQPYKGSTPAQNYDTFTDAFIKSLSASMSLPSEILLLQFKQNYSASLAALKLAWQVAEIWRQELVADYLAPIFEMWLRGEIAAGRVRAPGWSDPRMRQAWLAGDWVGFPMPAIDPLKAAKASETWAKLGATTLDRIARECNGSSGKSNRAKLKREYAEYIIPPWEESDVDTDALAEEEEDDNNGGSSN